jgi:hypothetical protein
MPRMEYCRSCGSEVERYEFTECKACHEYFCADCVNEDELCDQCCESAPREGNTYSGFHSDLWRM